MEEIRVVEGPNYVHLFSGGLDSAYSILRLAKEQVKKNEKGEIYPIFMDYGHFAASIEWNQVQTLTRHISKIVTYSILHSPIRINLGSDLFKWCHNAAFTGKEVGDKHPEIQNRNMVLLSIFFLTFWGALRIKASLVLILRFLAGLKRVRWVTVVIHSLRLFRMYLRSIIANIL